MAFRPLVMFVAGSVEVYRPSPFSFCVFKLVA